MILLNTTELCPPFNRPSNGRVYIIDDRQTALFVCDSGYSVKGSAHVTCVNGTWDSPAPVCTS